ncbi:restriction endonuclease subunit S [Vibrio sp. McD22-P3]|uniref:restriction endonuclease subunit S n=1 Tax=Vibrio sp. McD22-P3 TaxID=2724880 RepID=UPI001F18056C|nr:restriction endonuclease subunit S [Vibrio sp. McD22-P3]MCF4174468.1 restriction endonuclease subunit S [Vibrio sp. McD22-P3]
MTEQMNVPKLRFFDEPLTNVGFDSIAKIKIGLTHTPKYVAEGRPFLSSKNISGGYIDFDDIKYMSEEEFQTLPKSAKPKVGDILFTRVGSNLGNPIVLEDDIEFGIFVSLGAITVSERCNNHYVKHWMDTQYFWRQVEQKVAGGAKNNLNSSWLKEFKLKLPLLAEQQKIASFLSKVDEKITLLTEKKDKLTEYKKGLMQQLFNGKWEEQDGQLTFVPPTLRFKADDGSEFPDWEEKKLGDVATFSKGKGISKADIVEDGATPCVRYGELYTTYNEVIEKIKSKTNLPVDELVLSRANDVIIPSSGETALDIATASCIESAGIALSGDLTIIRSKMNGAFLSFQLNTVKKFELAALAQGASVIHLYAAHLKSLKVSIPQIEEQTKIVNFLSAIDKKIGLANSELEKVKEWKKGLLQQMFV